MSQLELAYKSLIDSLPQIVAYSVLIVLYYGAIWFFLIKRRK